MRIYAINQACGFHFLHAEWSVFSNFQSLPLPSPPVPGSSPRLRISIKGRSSGRDRHRAHA